MTIPNPPGLDSGTYRIDLRNSQGAQISVPGNPQPPSVKRDWGNSFVAVVAVPLIAGLGGWGFLEYSTQPSDPQPADQDQPVQEQKANIDCGDERQAAIELKKEFPAYQFPDTDPAEYACDLNGIFVPLEGGGSGTY